MIISLDLRLDFTGYSPGWFVKKAYRYVNQNDEQYIIDASFLFRSLGDMRSLETAVGDSMEGSDWWTIDNPPNFDNGEKPSEHMPVIAKNLLEIAKTPGHVIIYNNTITRRSNLDCYLYCLSVSSLNEHFIEMGYDQIYEIDNILLFAYQILIDSAGFFSSFFFRNVNYREKGQLNYSNRPMRDGVFEKDAFFEREEEIRIVFLPSVPSSGRKFHIVRSEKALQLMKKISL
ncbi:hypothetical protein GCM10007973_19320 [Polymorphobacter multimanifer]|uniref:Uncharacterized protein n=2 Tax=Polymorphobacter multimanifer TaxID=1070431 RepID=A0A841L8H8_9SPHN|nr:hypothetical protein [Polymorphobacter multimanifer]MBB6228496.1 hypothetical protein [Polymorphobacter multimanifer]GGI82954.1 hypothetical protein GCM10007973_19320 [Polymorphobacter multimanifer]